MLSSSNASPQRARRDRPALLVARARRRQTGGHQLVKTQLGATAKSGAQIGEGLGAETKLFVDGEERLVSTNSGSTSIPEWPFDLGIVGKVKSLETSVDERRGIAWFHARTEFLPNKIHMGGAGLVRVNGIARKVATGWRIAAVSYTRPRNDKTLVSIAKPEDELEIPATPSLKGDAALAKQALGWFPRALASSAATGKIVANGTAINEYGAGAAAKKLAAKWDKLGLKVIGGTAATFGDIGLVSAQLAMPIAKTKKAASLQLVAIAIKTARPGDGCR